MKLAVSYNRFIQAGFAWRGEHRPDRQHGVASVPARYSAQRVFEPWPTSSLAVGDTVRITVDSPVGLYQMPPHLRGQIGTVRAIRSADGTFLQGLAAGATDASSDRLFTIEIPIKSVWSDAPTLFSDVLRVEIGEPWLEQPEPRRCDPIVQRRTSPLPGVSIIGSVELSPQGSDRP